MCSGWSRLAGTTVLLDLTLRIVPVMPKTLLALPHNAPHSSLVVSPFRPRNNMGRWSRLQRLLSMLCRPTRTGIPQTFWIKILHNPILSKLLNPVKNCAFSWSLTTLKLSPKACLHYFAWIVSEISAKCLLFGWPRHGGKTVVAIFHALSLLPPPEKEKMNN